MSHRARLGIERRIKPHADYGISQHVTNLFHTVKKQGCIGSLQRLPAHETGFLERENGLPIDATKDVPSTQKRNIP